MLQELNRASGSTPPPCYKQGVKNEHSPWSAPRERKRRSKPAEVALSSIEEIEYTTSPPKRHNGGTSPAARELALQEAPLGSPFAVEAALVAAAADAGPLAQGLFAVGGPGPAVAGSGSDVHFSPLASGLGAPSFASGTQKTWQAAGDKQRKQLRQAAAFRLAASRQRATAAAAVASGGPDIDSFSAAASGTDPRSSFEVAAGHTAVDGRNNPARQPAHGLSSLQWQAAPEGTASEPFGFLAQRQQQLHVGATADLLEQWGEPCKRLPPAEQQQQQHAVGAGGEALGAGRMHCDAARAMHHEASQPGSGAARYSTGQDMETDQRASWGSDRSADVSGWQSMQARLREAVEGPPRRSMLDSREGGLPGLAAVGACRQQPSLPDDPMRASVDGALSTCSSLDAPSCSERQTSLVPLRSAGPRSHQWQSHLASPPVDVASPDPLLVGCSTGGSSRRRSRGGGCGSSGGTLKWSCFSCASPFSCKQRPRQDDSDDEVVRRNDSEDFVIRRKQSLPSPAISRGTADRPKHTTLNRPPSGEASGLVGRQDAFSVRCTPSAPRSFPCSEAGSDDSFSLASGPGLRSVGLHEASIEELAGDNPGSEGAPAPSVDALNDMLKALSLCPAAHPKDAEELVAQACQDHAIQPNATTARTLEKLWAVHEQLYG